MTLPSSYKTTSEYFKDSLEFLKTYQWLYNCSNTDILVRNTFENFPSEWLDYFQNLTDEDLNKLSLKYVEVDCPTSLKQFLEKVERLQPNITVAQENDGYAFPHNSGLTEKKAHEILAMAPIVHELCKTNGLDFIIDVGSGLGYLSHHLNERYHYRVLGLECSKDHIALAYKNQEKFHPQSKGEVMFIEHLINEDSAEVISRIAEQFIGSKKSCCIIGLHACADLSITILDLFEKLDFASCLAIMPCCYHRIKLRGEDGDKEYFRNFPLSEVLIDLFEEYEAHTFLKRPFLRLACQQSKGSFVAMTEEEHNRHARNFMFRAILQEVAAQENCRVTRLKRKSSKSRHPDPDEDFAAYLTDLEHSHRLERDGPEKDHPHVNDERFRRKMLEKWQEQKGNCRLVEVLTGMQASIQGVCENVVLLDRVEHLRRKGFRCRVEKVTNDLVSPRCHALIASKGDEP
ncbi:unnamed protein product [Phaedon cochleariae]|uniref:Methyltransferase domain-containing protein n=1 Tax=Phaedon cochleariae TaxID=80249 RepID=A0A9P0DKP0_PHACE|nr:unnamed protein product [Phaedon cochleariae]